MNEVSKEVLKRFDTVGEKIELVIKTLAEKIGVGAEHFWPVFVKQQYVEGVSSIITWIIPIIVGSIISYIFYKFHVIEKEKNKGYYEDGYAFSCGFSIVVTLMILIIALFRISYAIPKIFNPEYSALRDIIEMVNK